MKKYDINEICELSGIPMEEDDQYSDLDEEDGGRDTDSVIKALRDTDYRDKDAFFKMTQLLKGLAVASEKDEKAKKFMSSVSDALTGAAKKVLGEGLEEATGKGGVTGYSLKELYEFIFKSLKQNRIDDAISWYNELKSKGGDLHLANLIFSTGKLPEAVKKMK